MNHCYGVYRVSPLFRSQVDEQNIKTKQGITGVIDVPSLTDFRQNRVTRIKENSLS